MRVLIAGATGAIGRPLIGALRNRGHAVIALVRSPDSARLVAALGAEAVIADVLDAIAVKTAIAQARPEAVINELTSLPRHYTEVELAAAAERDREVRIEGNKNLLAALPEARVRRYLLQSSAFWYAPGRGLADEEEPLAFSASPAVAAGARRYVELEQTAAASGVEFVVLRYGFFYGPGTWFDSAGDMGEQVRRQQVPVIGDGQGVWSWVHIDDAAAATAAALECAPGAYNVVDDDPAPQHRWLAAFAHAVGAPPPPIVSEAQALAASGPDAVYYATRLRGASNGKAKRELGFRPRRLEWLQTEACSRITIKGRGTMKSVLCSLLLVSLPFCGAFADAPKAKDAKVTLVYQHELPNVPGKSIKGVLVEYGPGGYSPAHMHPKSAFIYATVLEGAIRSQVNDGPVTTYQAGQSFSELPGDRHAVSANASETQPAKLLAVFVVNTNETELTIPIGN